MTRIVDSLLSLVYPTECNSCRDSVDSASLGAACEECWSSTRIFCGEEILCVRCGAYLGNGSGVGAECGRCSDHSYETAFAIGVYEKALASSVLQLKHSPYFPTRLRHLCTSRLHNLN